MSGQIAAGTQLPSVRDLSAELHINPLTVAKVYQFLERDGLVETRRGLGTFVAAMTQELTKTEQARAARARAAPGRDRGHAPRPLFRGTGATRPKDFRETQQENAMTELAIETNALTWTSAEHPSCGAST